MLKFKRKFRRQRVKYMRKASVVFRFYCTFTSATCNTVDHILTGRSLIGRAPCGWMGLDPVYSDCWESYWVVASSVLDASHGEGEVGCWNKMTSSEGCYRDSLWYWQDVRLHNAAILYWWNLKSRPCRVSPNSIPRLGITTWQPERSGSFYGIL